MFISYFLCTKECNLIFIAKKNLGWLCPKKITDELNLKEDTDLGATYFVPVLWI